MTMRGFIATLLLALLLGAASPAGAYVLTPLDENQVVVQLETAGDSKDAAIMRAKMEAVRGAAGRALLSPNLFLADDLLERYLNKYANDFVRAVEVLEQDFVAGQNTIKARVYVDYSKLLKDLEDKKFLFRPAYKPKFATFMTERVDGAINEDGIARASLAQALQSLGMVPYENEISDPPSSVDVSIDEILLEPAIVSTQRAGVELIVSGDVTSTLRERKQLYYDEYWFYDTELEARLIRVDTGEILFSAKASGSASDRNPTDAYRTAIQRASERVAAQLFDDYRNYWPYVVQRQADYEILLTGVDEELLRIVEQHIERLGRDSKVYVRKAFDRSAVMTIVTDAPKDRFLENLGSCPFPTLTVVNPKADKYFEVQVGG